jgi:hypothetical protein
MNEGNIDVVDGPASSDDDAEEETVVVLDPSKLEAGVLKAMKASDGSESARANDHLPTTRLPPLTPPPAPTAALSAQAAPSRTTSTMPPTNAAPVPAPAKASWFRALLSSGSPPPAEETGEPDVMTARHRLATGCVAIACAFAAIGLIFAFRPVPSLAASAPVVVAATVVAHAIKAIGAGALCYGLLRMAERLSVRPGIGIRRD